MSRNIAIAIVIGSAIGGLLARHELANRASSCGWTATEEFERSMFCAEWRNARGIDREAFVWHMPGGTELVDDCATPRRWQLRVMQ